MHTSQFGEQPHDALDKHNERHKAYSLARLVGAKLRCKQIKALLHHPRLASARASAAQDWVRRVATCRASSQLGGGRAEEGGEPLVLVWVVCLLSVLSMMVVAVHAEVAAVASAALVAVASAAVGASAAVAAVASAAVAAVASAAVAAVASAGSGSGGVSGSGSGGVSGSGSGGVSGSGSGGGAVVGEQACRAAWRWLRQKFDQLRHVTNGHELWWVGSVRNFHRFHED